MKNWEVVLTDRTRETLEADGCTEKSDGGLRFYTGSVVSGSDTVATYAKGIWASYRQVGKVTEGAGMAPLLR
jgi:hypothetical protein